LKHFLHELQRRNVIKAAISYVVFSWVLIQAASILYPSFGWGQGAITNTVIVLVIGFPLWIVFAYVFEWTPKGFKKTDDVAEEASVAKTTGKKMNAVIFVGMALAIVLLVADRIFNFTGAMETPSTNDKSIAVLAFADMSPDRDQEYFSDGISEEILNLLAKIPDLKVISRTSSFSYKGKEQNIKKIGEELQVAHVLEGSIRKAGNTFRITAQLIDTRDGAHIWSETYDRPMDSIFKVQDEIAGRVTRQLKATLLGEIASATVDPKRFDEDSFVDVVGDVCVIPPNSFALASTVEYFRIPRNVLTICLGKSTYARCGIIVNVTPLEPEWEGHVTLEFSNTTTLPAKIYANEGVAQMLFFESDEVCEVSYKDRGGKYQGQRGVTLPKA